MRIMEKDNLKSLSFELSDAQMKELDDVSFMQSPYPWSEFW